MNLRNLVGSNGKILLMGVLCSLLVMVMLSSSFALVISMSLEEIIRDSDIILVGEIEDVKAYEGRKIKFIFSQATIGVHEVIKGDKDLKTVDFEFPGGLYDGNLFMTGDDVPLYKGDRVLLFLQYWESEIFEGKALRIKGSHRGTFKVDEDGIARGSGHTIENGERKSFIDLPLDELIEKIKSAL